MRQGAVTLRHDEAISKLDVSGSRKSLHLIHGAVIETRLAAPYPRPRFGHVSVLRDADFVALGKGELLRTIYLEFLCLKERQQKLIAVRTHYVHTIHAGALDRDPFGALEPLGILMELDNLTGLIVGVIGALRF